MSYKIEYSPLAVSHIVVITEKAVLVKLTHFDDEETWIPRSALSTKDDEHLNDKDVQLSQLNVARWFLKAKGL